MSEQKILCVVGTRPNFIKVAPLLEELKRKRIGHVLVHTGQHYDFEMSGGFFECLHLPKPSYYLGIGSASHVKQIAKMMIALEPVIAKEKPALVVVVGDVNSTIAAALVASKLGVKLAHIEAGLRSFDRTMPEEINRIVVDSLSDYLFVTEEAGVKNLKAEGIPESKIFFVGDILADMLRLKRAEIAASKALRRFNLSKGNYGVVTVHRPSNVDSKKSLSNVLDILDALQKRIKVILPLHPRTRKNIKKFKLDRRLKSMPNLIITKPLYYIDFMNLVSNSRFVLTDSGGIQSESTFLNLPCITLRDNTEKPVTLDLGTNFLCGTDAGRVMRCINRVILSRRKRKGIPKFWDGKTSERIVGVLLRKGLIGKR